LSEHTWTIYRWGGVDQVALQTGDDLRHLAELDPKLWLALSMPTKGVEIEARTLELLDLDKDGYIRHNEVLEAIKWLGDTFRDLDDVLEGGDAVALGKLKPGPVLVSAKRLLADLDKPSATHVALTDVAETEKAFANTVHNGDGIVPPDAAGGDVRAVMESIVATHGSVTDRSGKQGIDQVRIDAFFTEAVAVIAWHEAASPAALPLGDATVAAADAVRAVRAKIDDFFTRCAIVAYEPRAAERLAVADGELAELATKELSPAHPDVAHLPIARIEANAALPLAGPLNPAWRAAVVQLEKAAVTPLLGARTALTAQDWQQLVDKLAEHEAWRTTKPANKVDTLPLEKLRAAIALEPDVRAVLAKDVELGPVFDALVEVEKAVRYHRDIGTLLSNYVNFSRFYGGKGAVFQAGTLYLDGRACSLVLEVVDAAKHNTMAPMAGAYIAYCTCTRAGPGETTKAIACAFTAGDVDNLFVGRNGVFVDRRGRDWHATITKVIDNPISMRQAFWAPYKKLVRAIEERVAKRAASDQAEASTRLDETAGRVAEIDKGVVQEAVKKKPIDVGTVAALGVALGAIAAVATAVLGGVFGLGVWAPLGIIGVMLAISTPWLVLAYIKLRRRNLGPLLDANGWAINALTRINIPFGTALTQRATLPENAKRTFVDPYAEKRVLWEVYVGALVLAAGVGIAWYYGMFDAYVPDWMTSPRSDMLAGIRRAIHR
jgi:hypothetical protein